MLSEDRSGSENLQVFVKKHGENALPLFERLVTEAAKSGGNENPSLIMAAVDGLVLLRKGHAREVLEGWPPATRLDLDFRERLWTAWSSLRQAVRKWAFSLLACESDGIRRTSSGLLMT